MYLRYNTTGIWLKGNAHIHSTASDGGKTFSELAELYSAAGYDFLFRYVKEFIYDGKSVTGEWQEQGIVLHGLNYQITRIYYLSLLWRMGVSSHRMFKNVVLGLHEGRLRNMVLAGDAGEPEEYGFFARFRCLKGRYYLTALESPNG